MPKFIKFVSYATLIAFVGLMLVSIVFFSTLQEVQADRAMTVLSNIFMIPLGFLLWVSAILVLIVPKKYNIVPKYKAIPQPPPVQQQA